MTIQDGADGMSAESEIDALERALWAVMNRLSHRRFGDSIAQAAGYDLPPTSWTLLEFLSRSGPIRVSEIAAYSGVDISSVTPRLQALERDGFIARGADPKDGRVSLISIGAAGREAIEKMRTARRDLFAKAVQGTSAQQISQTSVLLEQLAEALTQDI